MSGSGSVSVIHVAPVLSGSNNLTAINENDTTNNGTLVSDLIAGQVTDTNHAESFGIAVTAVENTNGTWQYSTNGGSTWTAFGTPSVTAARLLAADADTRVRFVPNANWFGTVAGGLDFHAWDQTSGTAGATADVTTSGGMTAFSSATAAAAVTVNQVTQPPLLTLPTAQTTSDTVTFSVAQGNPITIGDVNPGGLPLTVSLTAAGGYVTLGGTTGLQLLTGTGRNDSAVSFSGGLADVQAAMEGLQFHAVTSQGLLQISVTNPGMPAWGGPRTTTGIVSINLFIQPIPVIPSPPNPSPQPGPSLPDSGPGQVQPNVPSAVGPTVSPATPTSHRVATVILPGQAVQVSSDRRWQPTDSLAAVHRPWELVDESAADPPKHNRAAASLVRAKASARGPYAAESPLDAATLWQQCGSIGAQLEKQQWSTKITVGAGVALTAGVSAGYVILLFRGGSLLASALASLPAWRSIDPLPVIEYWEKDEKRRRMARKGQTPEPDEQSLESLVK